MAPPKQSSARSKAVEPPVSHSLLRVEQVYNALIKLIPSRQHIGSIILDRFFRLAGAVGASRVLSGKHGHNVIRLADLDGIMARIEDEIGPDLPAPQQDGRLFGLRLRGGIQAAWRTREIAKASGKRRANGVQDRGRARSPDLLHA